MIDHKGHACAACHKALREGDDVVVCPECGAPYHRECYAAAGHCVFSAKHGAGFEYVDPEERKRRESRMECPICHAQNASDALFCEQCGQPLRPGVPPYRPDPTPRYAQGESGGSGTSSYGEQQYAQPSVMTQLHLAREYDGIDTKDWIQYIGNSAPYYLYQFQRMNESGRKVSFCWSALFFPEFYFFYRKMWGWGALAFAVSLLASVPPMLSMTAALGIPLSLAISERALLILVRCCGVVNWAIRIGSCLFGFYLFRVSAGKRLRALKEESADEDGYRAGLSRAGRPSRLAVLLAALALIGFSMAFYAWIGPERLMSALYMY